MKVLSSLSKPFMHLLALIKSNFVPHINLVNAEQYEDCSLFLPFKPVEPDIYSSSINICAAYSASHCSLVLSKENCIQRTSLCARGRQSCGIIHYY